MITVRQHYLSYLGNLLIMMLLMSEQATGAFGKANKVGESREMH